MARRAGMDGVPRGMGRVPAALCQPNVQGETPGWRERAGRVVKDPDAMGLTDFRKTKLLLDRT